jgi:outer membrane protein TolC
VISPPSRDSPSAPRDPLVTELAKAESELERIEAQRIAAKARIATLRNELAALGASPEPMAPEPQSGLAPRTPAREAVPSARDDPERRELS